MHGDSYLPKTARCVSPNVGIARKNEPRTPKARKVVSSPWKPKKEYVSESCDQSMTATMTSPAENERLKNETCERILDTENCRTSDAAGQASLDLLAIDIEHRFLPPARAVHPIAEIHVCLSGPRRKAISVHGANKLTSAAQRSYLDA